MRVISLSTVFIISVIGLCAELLFIGHHEGFWQYIPLVLLGFGLFLFILRTYWSVAEKLFKTVPLLFIVAGFLGIFFHLRSNVAFELEMYPNISGWTLIKKTVTGALPILAPGGLIPLGLTTYLLTNSKS